MGVLKNDVGRPSNKTIKARRVLIIIAVVIAAVAILLLGMWLEKKLSNDNTTNKKEEITTTTTKPSIEETKQKENNSDVSNKETNKIKEVENTKADKMLKDVLGKTFYFDFTYSNDNDIIYNSDDYKTVNSILHVIPKKIDVSCKKLYGKEDGLTGKYKEEFGWKFKKDGFEGYCNDSRPIEFYSYVDVDDEYKKLFGNDKFAKKENVTADGILNFAYSKTEKGYALLQNFTGDGGKDVISGVKKAYEKNNRIYIEYAVGLIDDALASEDYVVVTGANGKEFKVFDYDLTSDNKDLYKKYMDKLSLYRFEFFLEDGVYKFDKVKSI